MNYTFMEYVDIFNNIFKKILKIDTTDVSSIIISYCKEPSFIEMQINDEIKNEPVTSIIQLRDGTIALGTKKGKIIIWDPVNDEILL